MNEAKDHKKIIIATSFLVTILGVYLVLNSDSKITIIKNTDPSMTQNNIKPLTVANAWQGSKIIPDSNKINEHLKKTDDTNTEGREFILDYAMIHEEIGNIRLNEDGDIIVDDIALRALRRAFPPYRLKLTQEMLNEIEEVLKKGLPGKAGEQAADIIRKFYEFSVAKKEMASVYGDINLNKGNREESEAQIKALRTLYLGEELATQLFDKEDKETFFMYKTFEIATNKELTEEQKSEAQSTLKDKYISSLVNNWESRYQSYQEASNAIKQKQTLDSEERKNEMINLQKESFTIEELKIISRANISL